MADDVIARDKPRTGIKVTGTINQHITVGIDALVGVFGTDDSDQSLALMSQCLRVLAPNEQSDADPSSDARQFMFSIIMDLAPRDAVERMLAVQMAATHVAMMRAGKRMATVTELAQFEAQDRAYNKLARTFTAQMEALRKHRNGGKQTVVVQHVNVADGGQAIVGNVQHGGNPTYGG